MSPSPKASQKILQKAMEFLNGLEKAQRLGVTKDEFIRMWESEMKVLHSRPKDVSPAETDQGSTDDQLPQTRRQDQDELTQALVPKFQTLLDKNAEKQERFWQEMRNKNDQMTVEFREKIEIVCQHVKDTVEYQTNSLKLFFMHELEIMKQNLVKVLDDQCDKYVTSVSSSPKSQQTATVDLNQETKNALEPSLGVCDMEGDRNDSEFLPKCYKHETVAISSDGLLKTKQTDVDDESDITQKNSLSLRERKDDKDNNKLLPRTGYLADNLAQKEIKTENKHNEYLPEEDYDWHMESMDGSPSLKDRKSNSSDNEDENSITIPNLSSRMNEKKGSRFSYVVRSKARGSPTVNNQKDLGSAKSSYSSQTPVASLDDLPIEATGFYAKAISDQIKRSHSKSVSNVNDMATDEDWCPMANDEDWEISSEKETADYVSHDTKDLVRPPVFNYLHYNGFNVSNFSTYIDSDISYMSPFLYPGTQSWKARLCISFGSKGQLKVSVCISEGDGDKKHEWPIRITANGFIFHEFSKRFTQIWALPWVTCFKPTSRDARFSANVCLATKRGSYPNVTYDELEEKHYLENNKALFKWNLRAERIGKPSSTGK